MDQNLRFTIRWDYLVSVSVCVCMCVWERYCVHLLYARDLVVYHPCPILSFPFMIVSPTCNGISYLASLFALSARNKFPAIHPDCRSFPSPRFPYFPQMRNQSPNTFILILVHLVQHLPFVSEEMPPSRRRRWYRRCLWVLACVFVWVCVCIYMKMKIKCLPLLH